MAQHTFRVVVPIAGYVTLDVVADSPEDAVRQSSRELALRVTDLKGYDAQDASEVDHGLWVPNEGIQVTDLDDENNETNFTMIDGDVFHQATKGTVS